MLVILIMFIFLTGSNHTCINFGKTSMISERHHVRQCSVYNVFILKEALGCFVSNLYVSLNPGVVRRLFSPVLFSSSLFYTFLLVLFRIICSSLLGVLLKSYLLYTLNSCDDFSSLCLVALLPTVMFEIVNFVENEHDCPQRHRVFFVMEILDLRTSVLSVGFIAY